MLAPIDLRMNPPPRFINWPGLADWTPPPNFYVTGISIGVAGTVQIVSDAIPGSSADNTTIPANCLAVGVQHAMHFSKLVQAGTSATSIVIWGHYLA
jgi:hypothetical protein